jgi:hypothetical protein
MFPERLDIDFGFESFCFKTSVPLTALDRAFGRLEARNEESRARDKHPHLRPCLRVRVRCLECAAPVYCLTSVVRRGELLRACRSCRSEFPVSC